MKHYIIGDIHGKIEYMKVFSKKYENLIFLGDFVDAYDRSIEDQLACAKLALQLADEGRAQVILGNHELSYCWSKMGCSGHTVPMALHFEDGLREKFLKIGKSHIWFPEHKLLLAHGGLTKAKWDEQNLSVENLDERIKEDFLDIDSWVYDIGPFRGGLANTGGLFWCDWVTDFEPVEEIHQIVGHTRTPRTPRFFKDIKVGQLRTNTNRDWCIDCLDRSFEFLCFDDETGEITHMQENSDESH